MTDSNLMSGLSVKQFYGTLIDSMTDGLAVMDRDGNFTFFNDPFCRMLGYSREELLGSYTEVPFLDEANRRIARDQIASRREDRQEQYELELTKKEGGKISVLIAPGILRDESGGFTGSFGVVTDITRLKQAEEELKRIQRQLEERIQERTVELQAANDRLRAEIAEREKSDARLQESEKLAAIGKMAAAIGHEINNPLAGIKNSLQLIRGAIPPDHAYLHYADRMDREIDRIARIVRQMYGLYKQDSETPQEFSVRETIEDAIALFEGMSRQRDVDIELQLSFGPPSIVLPQGYFTEILTNLLQNAIEASPKGGTVRVTAEATGGVFSVSVADQGPGIPDADAEHIFEPFFTNKGPSATGGLGLGLAISKRLAKAMGGDLDYVSVPGGGAVFALTVPITHN